VSSLTSNSRIFFSLLLAVVLWGTNNVGLKYLSNDWPAAGTASLRFLIAGAAMLLLLRYSRWLGSITPMTPQQSGELWWRGALLLAGFMVSCNVALRFLPASHFALHMAASPVWALLLEGGFTRSWKTVRQFAAVALAFSGVGVLLAPTLRNGEFAIVGELMGLLCGLGWAVYSRQSRRLAQTRSPVEVTARSMWRAGILLLPFGGIELWIRPVHPSFLSLSILLYCSLFGAAAAYALWNHALTQWPSSRVFLFSNLIPLSTMVGAYGFLREPLTPTFAWAMLLILVGVLLGVLDFGSLIGRFWTPED